MEFQNVVVWDPAGKYWDGSLVGDAVVQQIKGRGGVCLPVDPALFSLSGVGGYFKRAWGAGYPCDHGVPRMFCPMSLYMSTDYRVLHWAARLVPDEAHARRASEVGVEGPGTISIMSYPARANTYAAPVTPVTQVQPLNLLGVVDERGGWTIGGRAHVNPSIEGNHAFALYGTASGLRVVWAAITVVKA